jgi:hypothetical protein
MHQPSTLTVPRSAAWLGNAGLLPFLILAPVSLIDYHHAPLWRDAMFTYGAVILSFVGALHWAFAMTLADLTDKQRTAGFIWSVVPALLAWPAALVGSTLASVLLVLGFVAHYLQDMRLARRAPLPAWYLPLRFRLTLVACLCLSAAGVPSVG